MRIAAFLGMFLIAASSAQAWNGTGHMTVAYVAYQNLTPQTRARVDQLLTLNPMYATWTAKTPTAQKGLVAFLSAATWPDCIKEAAKCPGYHEDGADSGDTPPPGLTASQNVGYSDKAMHKYWHYVDLPFSPAGLPAMGPKSSNAALQIPIFTAAIGGSVSDNIKSYDVAWLEHLVGDIHQPLHAVSRFTRNHPKGDTGGNDVKFCNSPCDENLHAYWDDLLGTKTGLTAITRLGTKLLQQSKPQGADIADVHAWATESFTLATKDAYAPPIGADDNPATPLSPKPNPMYRAEAKTAAEARILLAGYRLANLLNLNLK
jgi:hypothetical protein